MTIQIVHPESDSPRQRKQPDDLWDDHESNLDILQLLIDVLKYWKMILVISLLGTLIVLALVMQMPKVYRANVQVSLPSIESVFRLNKNGLENMNQQEMFNEFYNTVRKPDFFKQFVVSHGYLNKLFPNQIGEVNIDRLFGELYKGFSVTIDEPKVKAGEFATNPTLLTIRLESINEVVQVELLNQYIQYANHSIVQKMVNEQTIVRDERIEQANNQIALLRESAAVVRELEIKRRGLENEQTLADLYLKKSLLIEKANKDRLTEISIIEERNQEKLTLLRQKKALLIAKAKEDRKTEIAVVEHARKMAESLNIVYPTRLQDLDRESDTQTDGKTATNITISDNQTLPSYLMGTKYLDSLLESLKSRTDDARYLSELNEIDIEIKQIEDDRSLERLKKRETEEPYLAELNELDRQIEMVKNDPYLNALKMRESDDPYIEQIPSKLEEIAALRQKSLNFTDINMFQVNSSAAESGTPVKPRRKLLVIGGALLFGIIALFIALIKMALDNRKTRHVHPV